MASWKELYAATVRETDLSNLRSMIFETEIAIDARVFELTLESNASEELKEINDATAALKVLKQEVGRWDNYEAR